MRECTSVKKIIIALIIVMVIGIAIVFYVALPWTLIIGSHMIDAVKKDFNDVLKPEMTYGEFNVELTYEYNGEIFTVSDVLVCEFSTYETYSGAIVWNSHMKSTGEKGFLLYENDTKKVYCFIGGAEYFMGQYQSPTVSIGFFEYDDSILSIMSPWKNLTEEELYQQYNITIVSWNADEPIQNSFENFGGIYT